MLNDSLAIDLLEAAVRIPSLSGQEARFANWLAARLGELGFRAELDGAGNVVAQIGAGPVRGVLLGHLDTVPGGPPVRREGGWLHGRGSVDAKGPLLAFVVAAARAAATPRSGCALTVVGCVEEEAPSSRGARFVLDRPAPDFCLVGEPSGWAGITLGYKGYLGARLRFRGPTQHTAAAARTACERACEAWRRIEERAAARAPAGAPQFERLSPALTGFQSWLEGDEEVAELSGSLRLPESLPPGPAAGWLLEAAGDGEVEVTGAVPAWSGPRHTPLHRALHRAIARRGGRPRYLRKTGTADLNLVAPAWRCPALAYGPGDSNLDHTPGERIELAEYLRAIEVLEEVLAASARWVDAVPSFG